MERYVFSEEKRAALEGLRQPLAVYQFLDRRVVTLLLSDGFCDLFGYADRAEAVRDMDNNMYKDTHPDDAARIADAAIRFATEGGKYEVIYRTRKKDGTGYVVVHAMGEHVYPEEGVRLAQVWYTDEGTYLEDAQTSGFELTKTLSNALHEQSILTASRYDYLTGLPSMTYFFELAEAGKSAVLKEGGQPILLYLDFCGMKFFNRKHGFGEGDRMLRQFADLLKETFSAENCCRIGGDHFSVCTQEQGLEEKLHGLFRAWQELRNGAGLPVHVGVYRSIGDAVHTSVALDRARLACRALKDQYCSCFRYYSRDLSEDISQKQYIIENLDRAIEEHWIQVYLQPIIRAVNGRVCDVEALARWIDPEKGFLSPADFIPVLEETGLIYKLDLFMVEQVLEAIQAQRAEGFYIVPHSINLSRSDFDACDMVEEIRKRVDAAGVARDRITIELTESVIGSNFAFMKEQVERFQALGFPVWMDDFGSGYSSLEVLQSIRFDLLKFDMSFMRRLEEGENGKVLLTELMRMATSMGLDTVCEGVETQSQMRFLQEIGCSKLQGYYYSRPISFETIRERRRDNSLIENENPRESDYYESIGRVNLFDLGVIAGSDAALQNAFSTIPIAVMEVTAGSARYVRSNRSYQEFVRRFFAFDVLQQEWGFGDSAIGYGAAFLAAVRQCCEQGGRCFFDEKMADGSVVHSFVRRIRSNPVTGSTALAIAVLSVTEPEERANYADIARALAADYYSIYAVDLDTDRYIQYSSRVGSEELSLERHGEAFFPTARQFAMERIHEADRDAFRSAFTKETILRELDAQGVFTATFRLLDAGGSVYVQVKVTRMQGGNRIILGVSNVDAQMRQQEEEKRLRKEKNSLGRIAALSPDFFVLYTVDLATGQYTQYNPSSEFARFALAQQGEDFFADVRLDAPRVIDPEDLERHLRLLTRDNVLRVIRKNGVFYHNYRLLMGGKSVPVSLKATLVQEDGGEKLLLGVVHDDKEEYRRRLREAQKIRALNQRITSLLDNMPAMTFTKDAETGVYLACNQAFAAYAHKATPDGVVGLTDAEIFDAETAAHFVEDDQTALSMDKPFIFYEDVPDAAGNQRQFQTTKLKYVDASGRLCLQGMCQDVTDMVRIRHENAATKVAYEQARSTSIIYTHIAQALARGITDLYYVNLETGEFIEYHTDDTLGVLTEARRGTDFFAGCERDAKRFVHPEDQTAFVRAMNRDFLEQALENAPAYKLTYRRIKEEKAFYVRMRVSRVKEDPRFIVVAVSDIDELMRKRRAEERMMEERVIYARLHALTGNFLCVYVVDPESGHYREFSATDEYEQCFAQAKDGTDFFDKVRREAHVFNHPEDLNRFLAAFTKEKVMAEIARSGFFTLSYRLMVEGKPLHIQMKAAMVEEKGGPRLIVGLNNVDLQVRQEEELEQRLTQAQCQANLDALTGVKNKHAYLEAEAQLDRRIAEQRQQPFALVMLDVNGLKKVNDTLGHQAGDELLRDACKLICDTFTHSPVFRVGGDEFVVLSQGADYQCIEELVQRVHTHNQQALRTGGTVVACGMAKYEDDSCVAAVFERSDHEMFRNKRKLKGESIP